MTNGFSNFTIRDYDNEVGNVRMRAATITAANFDAQTTLRGNLATAMNAITLADSIAAYSHGNENVANISPATAPTAQRELKWLVQYHESGGVKPYHITVPCADPAALDANDRAHAEIGDGSVVDAFITAFEAFVLGPNGAAVVVDEITLVGRNV